MSSAIATPHEQDRQVRLFRSIHAGHLEANRALYAARDGADPQDLIREAVERITALRAVDRLEAFHRGLQRGCRQ